MNNDAQNAQSLGSEQGDITQRVKALDTDAMTEEDARLTGISLLEEYVERNKSNARFSLIFEIIWDLILVVLFDTVDGGDIADEFWDYRRIKRVLKKFKKDTYKKGYRCFLKDWRDRILRQEELSAQRAAAAELKAQKKAEKQKKKPS